MFAIRLVISVILGILAFAGMSEMMVRWSPAVDIVSGTNTAILIGTGIVVAVLTFVILPFIMRKAQKQQEYIEFKDLKIWDVFVGDDEIEYRLTPKGVRHAFGETPKDPRRFDPDEEVYKMN